MTFVTASPGSKPSPIIENTVDVFDYTGYIKDYDDLMVAVRDIVETREHNMFFHNDIHHKYKFDGTNLHNGAVSGRQERRKEDG